MAHTKLRTEVHTRSKSHSWQGSHAATLPLAIDCHHSASLLGQPSPPQPHSSHLADSQAVDPTYGRGGPVLGPEQQQGQVGEHRAILKRDDYQRRSYKSHATHTPSQFYRQHSAGSLGQPITPPQPRPSHLPHSRSVDPNSRDSFQLAHSQSVDMNYGRGEPVSGPEQRRGQAGEHGALSNHADRHRQQSDGRSYITIQSPSADSSRPSSKSVTIQQAPLSPHREVSTQSCKDTVYWEFFM